MISGGKLQFLCKVGYKSGTGQSQSTSKHHARCIPERVEMQGRRTSLFGTSSKIESGQIDGSGVCKIGNLPISRHSPGVAELARLTKMFGIGNGLTSMRTRVVLACDFQALHLGL